MSGMSRNTVGHSGKCTVCQLCLKSNAKIKHLNQMNVQPQFKEAYTWLKEHQPTINDSACICLPCVKQIQRNHSKEFTPRWLPKPPVPLKLCNLEHCKCIVYAQTTLVTVDELEKCLKQKVNAFTVTSDQSRVDTESKSMPTTEALLLHWNRCMWIVAMWHSATLNSIDLPGMLGHYNVHTCICNTVIIHLFCFAALTDYGWKRENGVLEIVGSV